MRTISILAIIVISVLLIGCAKTEITAAGETSKPAKTLQPADTTEKTYTVQEAKGDAGSTYTVKDGDSGTGVERDITIKTTEGDPVTLSKLKMYDREKGVTEECYLPSPFVCTSYKAKKGIVYLTIKNAGYQSKLDRVTLTLDNDECDPAGTYIETGNTKEFECYADAKAEYVSGTLEINYYMPIGDRHDSKFGKLTVLME